MIRLKTSFAALQFFFFLFILFSCSNCSFAQADGFDYEALKKEYFRLRNIDPQVKDPDSWNLVLEKYKSAYLNNRQDLQEKFFYDYAALLEQIAQARSDHKLYEQGIEVLDYFISTYPDSALADDAKFKQTEILALSGASEELLKENYQQLIARYPRSDSAQLALNKLKNLDKSASKDSIAEKTPATQQVQPSASALPVLVIDAGHGGDDFGAVSDLGLLEKDVSLSIALELEKILVKRKIATPVLTRRSDIFVPLKDRVTIANNSKAVVLISLHCNASLTRNQSGITAYILDNSSDEGSQLLAERENKSAGQESVSDLDFILGDLIQDSKHPESAYLAETLNKSLNQSLRSEVRQAKLNKVKKAPFFVLVGTHMPSTLLELLFIDNEAEAQFLADPKFRITLAEGLANGLKDFLEHINADRG